MSLINSALTFEKRAGITEVYINAIMLQYCYMSHYYRTCSFFKNTLLMKKRRSMFKSLARSKYFIGMHFDFLSKPLDKKDKNQVCT